MFFSNKHSLTMAFLGSLSQSFEKERSGKQIALIFLVRVFPLWVLLPLLLLGFSLNKGEDLQKVKISNSAWVPNSPSALNKVSGLISVKSGCVVISTPSGSREVVWPKNWTAETDGLQVKVYRGDKSVALPLGAELKAFGDVSSQAGCTGSESVFINDDLRS